MKALFVLLSLLLCMSFAKAKADDYKADRVRIMNTGEICISERNTKDPKKPTNPVCSSDYATTEERYNYKEFEDEMLTLFNDDVKKSLLDDFLESRKGFNDVRKFTTRQFREFVASVKGPKCESARKDYDNRKIEIQREIESLKKKLAALDERSESSLKILMNSCSPNPKARQPQRSTNPAR